MSTIMQIKIFNDLLEQFFEYLENNFHLYKSDILLTHTAVDFVRKSNPRLVVENYISSVKPYKKELFDCNENFFLDYGHDLNLEDTGIDNSLILKIKSLWTANDTTDKQKAYIWLYLQKLYKAGEKIIK